MNEKEYTLTEIAWILNQPQHRLTYLCEKGVIVPDKSDAKGRGSSRRFSPRNLFEFSIALVLSEFHIPAVLSRKIIFTLRSFQEQVSQSIPEFDLPIYLKNNIAPQVNLILVDGSTLYFTLCITGKPCKLIGAVHLNETVQAAKFSVTDINFVKTSNPQDLLAWIPKSSSPAFFVLNLTNLAQELKLEQT